jgi:hypothetical protein
MSTEAARLVDELTTLLYSPCLGTCITHGPDCRIVVCGACLKKADKPSSVVHESDCPVYRLIRAEEANTAVIRANAEEIADLEDKRDELEARVNAVVVEIEHERKMFAALTDASVRRIDRLTAERDAALARAEAADERTITGILQDLLDMPPDDPDHDDAIIVLYDHLLIVLERWVKYGGIEPALGGYRAALAAATPGDGGRDGLLVD